ncbi:hypothetical protein Q6D67_20800 [Haliea sp. E1-2-M8]|nr:hypothetical protein [Haliea sp. E1-2-M8]MDO8864129.1 hypothetical protein [Haliea sp. E1-2-M8]
MTSIPISTLIAEGDPLTPPDWNEQKEREAQEQRELVRQRCEEEYSSSPLWRARAERDPEFWKKFSPGRIR